MTADSLMHKEKKKMTDIFTGFPLRMFGSRSEMTFWYFSGQRIWEDIQTISYTSINPTFQYSKWQSVVVCDGEYFIAMYPAGICEKLLFW